MQGSNGAIKSYAATQKEMIVVAVNKSDSLTKISEQGNHNTIINHDSASSKEATVNTVITVYLR